MALSEKPAGNTFEVQDEENLQRPFQQEERAGSPELKGSSAREESPAFEESSEFEESSAFEEGAEVEESSEQLESSTHEGSSDLLGSSVREGRSEQLGSSKQNESSGRRSAGQEQREASAQLGSQKQAVNDESRTGLDTDEKGDTGLWEGDSGTLDFFTRKALLRLVRGPLLTEERSRNEWQALVNNMDLVKEHLAELFLELVVDYDAGIAFVRNASSEERQLPKAVKTLTLTLIDTVMLLHLRRELLVDTSSRVILGREELLLQLDNYRPLAKLDEAAFRKRLRSAWSRFVKAGILLPLDSEERCEVSPVLKLLFGVDEVKALSREYELLLKEKSGDGYPSMEESASDEDDLLEESSFGEGFNRDDE